MKIGNKVFLKEAIQLAPVGASTPRSADLRTFDKGSEFTLVNIEGEKAIVKDESGNFWSVLIGFLGLVTEATTLNGNTTINQGVSFGKKVVNWFKSVANLFKKKK